MALTLLQRDALTINAGFLGRVRQCVRQHATTLLAGAPTPQQTSWCANCFWTGKKSNQIAADLAPQLVNDPAVAGSTTGDGTDITDVNLQAAVDVICEKYM